jgi:hypothetical protein
MKIVIVIITLSIMGCANFVASVSGTFIGNIASDRYLKKLDKNDKNTNTVQTNM